MKWKNRRTHMKCSRRRTGMKWGSRKSRGISGGVERVEILRG
jgi:hypothetical protein